MAGMVNAALKKELKALGSQDIEACFHCGNCTAVCHLTSRDTVFPRKVIRYVQLGWADRLAESPEPWLCYACGECTTTCPRQAGPAEFMAAARRYAVGSADPTRLALVMFQRPWVMLGVTFALAVIFGLFLLTSPSHAAPEHWLFTWIPYEAIHNIGLGVGALLLVLMAAGLGNALRRFTRGLGGVGAIWKMPWSRHAQALKRLGAELITMRRHARCAEAEGETEPWYVSPHMVHWAIMWGFLGLLGATT